MKTNDGRTRDKHHGRWLVAMGSLGALMLSAMLLVQTIHVDNPGIGKDASMDRSAPAQARPAGGSTFTLGLRG